MQIQLNAVQYLLMFWNYWNEHFIEMILRFEDVI